MNREIKSFVAKIEEIEKIKRPKNMENFMRRLVLFACIVAQLIGKTEYQINQIFTQMMSPNNSHDVERNNKFFKIYGK